MYQVGYMTSWLTRRSSRCKKCAAELSVRPKKEITMVADFTEILSKYEKDFVVQESAIGW